MVKPFIFGATALALSGGAASAQVVYVAPYGPYGVPAYVAPVPPVVFAPAPVYVAPYVTRKLPFPNIMRRPEPR